MRLFLLTALAILLFAGPALAANGGAATPANPAIAPATPAAPAGPAGVAPAKPAPKKIRKRCNCYGKKPRYRFIRTKIMCRPCKLGKAGQGKACRYCRGKGFVWRNYRKKVPFKCRRCKGKGWYWAAPCRRCKGKGSIRYRKKIGCSCLRRSFGWGKKRYRTAYKTFERVGPDGKKVKYRRSYRVPIKGKPVKGCRMCRGKGSYMKTFVKRCSCKPRSKRSRYKRRRRKRKRRRRRRRRRR